MAAVVFENISKFFPAGDAHFEVLQNTSITLEKGGFYVISGPSGSGKSTALNLIGALDTPDSGAVHVNGVNLANCSDNALADFRNKTIGFIFQSFHLVPVLTACENVAWPLYMQGIKAASRIKRAKSLLVQVGLGEHVNKLPGKLSGGQCQRVAIARALANEPRLILADEPTANLDAETTTEIMNLFQDICTKNKVTFICATHDPAVMAYATNHIHIKNRQLSYV